MKRYAFTLPVPEKFWSRVTKTDGCWEWSGYRRTGGYGEVSHRRGVKLRTHRIAYELTYGPIPDGLQVCHHCDNPPCCNPAHLFLGTHKDNSEDCVKKGRTRNGNTGKAICKRGHPLDGENVFVNRRGLRSCRICNRARCRRYYWDNIERERKRPRGRSHQ